MYTPTQTNTVYGYVYVFMYIAGALVLCKPE